MYYGKTLEFNELLGKTFSEVTGTVSGDEIVFTEVGGQKYKLLHQQDCCELVQVEDICGNLTDLVGNPILQAEEVSSRDEGVTMEFPATPDDADASQTWTFYRLSTIKGTVTIRWFGSSNGYYSEDVDLVLDGTGV